MTVLGKAGNFTKATGAATATQTAIIDSGFGAQPKALILFSAAQTTNDAAAGPALHAIGIATPSTARSFSSASGASGITTKSFKRAANKALTAVSPTGTTLFEGDATFKSDGTIDLAWTTNDANADYIGYAVLGGTSLSASIVEWASRTSTGSKAITGAGFGPNSMFTLGDDLDTALPRGGTFETHMMGAAASGSGAWAHAGWTFDGAVGTTTSRLYVVGDGPDALADNTNRTHATLTSWDADGVTLNYDVVQGWQTTHASKHASLFLAGGVVQCGSFSRPTTSGPVTSTITTTGMRPVLVLMATCPSKTADASTVQNSYIRSFGAADASGGMAIWSAYGNGDASSSNGNAITETGKTLVSNNPGTVQLCGLPTLNNGSFSVTWNPNDSTTADVFYFAIGESASTTGADWHRRALLVA